MKKILSELKQRSEDNKMIKKIEEGLKKQEFKMHLQFIVDNKTRKIVSAEALSRWERADGEIIPPIKYIGVMERCGLISKLDYCMFEMACKKLSEWKGTELDNITLSCNFTRITISEKDFTSTIQSVAERYDFERCKLLIEITEDSIEKNLEVAMQNIIKVKELGFCIALDDIGSGYTSLVSLCEYPIDVVKMDRDILLLTDKERGKKLFSGIISLAHYLNLSVVCEGVETEEQNLLVTESACDYIQGWYYCKAMPENKADEFAISYMQSHFKGEPA
ncbi:MAG: EAL domain-containing protein [Clostridia bacterium]|nr:EAL domain-containing protein [Clostridia bacterium]